LIAPCLTFFILPWIGELTAEARDTLRELLAKALRSAKAPA
jgi:hypothetical protein